MRAIACAKSVAGGSSINDLWIFNFHACAGIIGA
jgi:hypothetical protein